MPNPRDVLSPSAFAMLQCIAETGSFSAAARAANLVPSALTYRVRQIEEALDVLLFDRRSQRAKLTPAGDQLLREGMAYLEHVDAVANRIRRVAAGWEPQLTISVDGLVSNTALMQLCKAFYALNAKTELHLRTETLSGTLELLALGRADLAIGVIVDPSTKMGLHRGSLGTLRHVFTMAPHHPLASQPEPLPDEIIRGHRTIHVADSVLLGDGMKVGVLGNQEALTTTDLNMAIDAQVRGIAVGYIPMPLARPYMERGQLIAKAVVRTIPEYPVSYVWQQRHRDRPGKALQWWLDQLNTPATRAALIGEPLATVGTKQNDASIRKKANA